MKIQNCLVVNGHSGRRWLSLLSQILDELGEWVRVGSESDLVANTTEQFNLVVLDPVSTSNLALAIVQARQHYPKAGIAVFSADPTWQQARECYRAGANVYAAQQMEHDAIASTLQRALAITDSTG
jgi:DNA-binding NtrC family response regulator